MIQNRAPIDIYKLGVQKLVRDCLYCGRKGQIDGIWCINTKEIAQNAQVSNYLVTSSPRGTCTSIWGNVGVSN
jgi:hypothetical protein